MSNKILDSKIQIPVRLKNFISRQELLDLLMDCSVKVVVLNAGAGYGKTMLLTNYAMESADKCAWYHLSSLDNDIMTFVKYLSCSLNKVIDSFDFVYDNQENLSGDKLINSIANEFLIYLSRFSDVNISILLDDFQEIDNEEIYEFLTVLIRNTSESVRLLMATKGSFPKFLARFMLHGTAMMVNDRQLAFNREDIMRILQDIRTIDDIGACAELILDYTEGWPAGVIAIALALKNEHRIIDKEGIVRLCKETKVYDYIMYEVFKKLPFDIQTFLINTSVLIILSSDLCNAVMNISTAKSTLDYLVQENVFVILLSGKGNVYRYHSIFKDYLTNQISKSTEQTILRKAALFCLNKGDYEQAIEYSIACGDLELMQAAFEEIGMSAIVTGKVNSLSSWIDYLLNSKVKLTCKTRKIFSAYYYYRKDMTLALEYIEGVCEDYKTDNNENEYIDAILMKNKYMEEKTDYNHCLNEILEALSIVKKKNSFNWYILKERIMELMLLLNNEAEAVKTAEEINAGSMMYIRGAREEQVNNIKSMAEAVLEIGSLHMKEEPVPIKEFNLSSELIRTYLNWCQLHYLYLSGERDKALQLIMNYLDEQQIMNIYMAYIKVVGCIILLNYNSIEAEAELQMQEAVKYLQQYKHEYPKLLKQDLIFVKSSFSNNVDNGDYKKIYVRCFDNGEIYVDDQSLAIKWRTKKTFELFVYLFDQYGKAVSKDKIISVLWPDMSYEKSAVLFHTTLSYLRKNLSENRLGELLCGKGGRYLLDVDKIDSDYDLLMEFQRRLHTLKFGDRMDVEEFIELYKGSFFENISSEWIINKREHMERVYVNCCKSLAKLLLDAQRYMECTAVLDKVIKLDPYSEELRAMYMRACCGLGDLKSVKSCYDNLDKILKDELDCEISPELQKLFNELIQKRSEAILHYG